MVLLMDRAKLYVEGAGAVGVAAVPAGARRRRPARGTTCVVLSGGNVDLGVVPGLIRRHETEAGRRLVVFARDRRPPGEPGPPARRLRRRRRQPGRGRAPPRGRRPARPRDRRPRHVRGAQAGSTPQPVARLPSGPPATTSCGSSRRLSRRRASRNRSLRVYLLVGRLRRMDEADLLHELEPTVERLLRPPPGHDQGVVPPRARPVRAGPRRRRRRGVDARPTPTSAAPRSTTPSAARSSSTC